MHGTDGRLWIRVLGVVAASAASVFFAVAPAYAGEQDNVKGWAWSGTIGWISMNCRQSVSYDTCGDIDYGVTMETTTGFADRADISGWAWSETMGWICFGATCTGTTPEGGAPYAQYRSVYNGKDDQFVGWAQVVALEERGWISLNCENLGVCASSNYRVELNDFTGEFTKGAFADHYAWSGNDDGTGIGWVEFGGVSTTWTLADIGMIHRPQGIYEPDNPGLMGTHLHTFEIGFTNLSAPESYMLSCDIARADNSIIRLRTVFSETMRHVTAGLNYTITNADPIDNNRPWIIQNCAISTFPSATACVSDAACGAEGICDLVTGFCRDIVDGADRRRPVFTHTNDWTGTEGSEEDQYRAIKCFAGFPGQYFKNAQVCDFTGDASFALVMRRSIPVEGDCGDGLDNDGNGQTDCADRNCKGISYLCASHPPTICIRGQSGDNIADCTEGGYIFGDLCCSQQPVAEGSSFSHIVDGLECSAGDPDDGYFACDCTSQAAFDASGTDDCFAPGFQGTGLCCSAEDEVMKL